MTTVRDIVLWLEAIAPQAKKESWDNVGLLCGSEHRQVRTILVALDPFEDVVREAVDIGADLILTHHPLIFHSADRASHRRPLRPYQSGYCPGRSWASTGPHTGVKRHFRD